MANIKELIQREKIRTMKKDLSRLRLSEAEREKEKIAKLKVVEEAREKFKKAVAGIGLGTSPEKVVEPVPTTVEEKKTEEKVLETPELPPTAPAPLKDKSLTGPEPGLEPQPGLTKETEIEKRLKEAEERVQALKEILSQPSSAVPPASPVFPREAIPSPPPSFTPPPSVPELTPQQITPPTPLPPFAQRPSPLARRLARGLVIILILLAIVTLITFLYWFFRIRGSEIAPGETLPTSEVVTPPIPAEETPPVLPEPEPPQALISADQALTLAISSPDELAGQLKEALSQEFTKEQLTRVLIKNTSSNQFLDFNSFLNALGLTTPSNLVQKLGPEFDLLLLAQKQGNRLGLIIQIQERKNLDSLLLSWQKTMAQDFENFFGLIPQEKARVIAPFKSVNYKGVKIIYQTFHPNAFGICYAVTDQYLLFNTSCEGLIKILNRL